MAKRSTDTLRNDALISLAVGEVDRAVADLTEAAELDPGNAIVWNDLAAAHLQRSTMHSDPYELVPAFTYSTRAIQRAPSLLSARFNRALVLEHLSLKAEARKDWQVVLRSERDPSWFREAKAHIEDIAPTHDGPGGWSSLSALERAIQQGDAGRVRSIVSGSPQRFREYAEETLLATWANEAGPAATKSLAVARAIGAALAATTGERMVADTIGQIDSANATDPRRARRLIRALQAYGKGISLMQQESFSQALPCLTAAKKSLERAGSPFAGWASFKIAYSHYRLSDNNRARGVLLPLARTDARRFAALHGRALWLLGLIDGVEGSTTASLTNLEFALADFQKLGEGANSAWLRGGLIALVLDLLGQRTEAWRQLHLALQEQETLDNPRARALICDTAALMAREQGETELSLAFLDEWLRSAYATGQPTGAEEALRWHATLLIALGRNDQAAAELVEASRWLKRVADPSARRSSEGDLLLVKSQLLISASPLQVIAALDTAIQIFRDTAYHYQMRQALYLRARAEDQLGRYDDEERDLSGAIAESERQRQKVTSPEDRISYFDRTRELLDTMVSFQLERRHNPTAALRFSEQAKARVLWDWILTQPGGGPDPSHLDETQLTFAGSKPLQENLPEGIAVIEYATLPRSTVIWILRRGMEPQVVTVKRGAGELGTLVQKLNRAIQGGQTAAFKRTSEDLYELLLAPIGHDLDPGERLILVPDEALHALSFALLRNRRTGKYLSQEHISSVAPSIRVFNSSRHAAVPMHPRALVIADPAFDQGLYPTLPRLDSGATESLIAHSFPGSLVLRDRNATRSAFLRLAGGFEIVHFGGHSVINTEFPLLSQMVLAPKLGDPDRGVLYSGDLLRQRLPKTCLVVLASCATAAGRISRTEGVENLARPFLAVGVPVVIASLWNVNDKVTADFFSRFYGNLQKGWDVAGALQATQVDFIEHGTDPTASPRTWAAFEVIGASVPADGKLR
jgi:CHAT domain-containing protein